MAIVTLMCTFILEIKMRNNLLSTSDISDQQILLLYIQTHVNIICCWNVRTIMWLEKTEVWGVNVYLGWGAAMNIQEHGENNILPFWTVYNI